MTKSQFIILLLAYGTTIILSTITNKFSCKDTTSQKSNFGEILKLKSRFFILTIFLVAVFVLGCGLVGFIGMVFFWPLAPWIFGIGVISKIFGSRIFSGLIDLSRSNENSFDALESLLAGVILTLIFFGPAKHLFFAN